MNAKSLRGIVSDYILANEVSEATADLYHRVAGYLCSWHGGDVPDEDFTADLVNRYLVAMQERGLSGHYRHMTRTVLCMFFRFAGKTGKVRNVKREPLEPHAWTPEEVERLIATARTWRKHRKFWVTVILLGYYTGLNESDLRRLDRSEVGPDGVLRTRRGKTQKRVIVQLPQSLLDILPLSGPLLAFPLAPNAFKMSFRRIVKRAGLQGSFKTLRKTAGTLAEKMYPGRGHLLLANTRKVFEAHYLGQEHLTPIGPPHLPLTGTTDRPDPPRAA